MEIIRKKTDYSFRLMLNLSMNFQKGAVSARLLSEEENVSYQLTCKLLQQLQNDGYVKSSRGPKGGYVLNRSPSEISLADIVKTIQSPIRLRDCLLGINDCPKNSICSIQNELQRLGNYIDDFLNKLTLDHLMKIRTPGCDNKKDFLVNKEFNKEV